MAREILLDAAHQGELVLRDPPAVVLDHSFHPTHGTDGLDGHTDHDDEEDQIRSQLLQTIHERCEREGMSLLIPQALS
jgi:small-conductance mechanosensitive channel